MLPVALARAGGGRRPFRWDGVKVSGPEHAVARGAADSAANGGKNAAFMSSLQAAIGSGFRRKLLRDGVVVWEALGPQPRNKIRNPSAQGAVVGGQNLVLRSQELTTAPWQIGGNLTANGIDGTLAGVQAFRFTSTGTSNSYVRQTVSTGLVAGATYTASFLCDTNSGGSSYLRIEGPNTQTVFTVTQVEAGLFRYTCTITYPASGATGITIHAGRIDAPASTTFRTTAVQLTQSPYLLPYVPTTTAAVDSAGTQPTHWSVQPSGSGITRHIVGIGTEAGLSYIDIRYSGTASANVFAAIRPEFSNVVAAASGQTWTNSTYVRLVGGSLANLSIVLGVLGANSSGSAIDFPSNIVIVPTAAELQTQRFARAGTLSGGTIAFVAPYVQINASSGAVIDITLRIAAPQLELAAAPTAYVDPVTDPAAILPIVNNAFVLPSTATQVSIAAADIDTGTWIHRVESASNPAKYIATRVTPVGGGGPATLSGDLEDGGGVTLGEFVLYAPAFDSVVASRRWHPGHYMQCTDAVGRSGIAQSKRSITAANPNFIGYQVSIFWGQTELTQGDYSALYTQLDAIRAAAQADGKKIWLRLFERSFHGPTGRPAAIPQYIVDAGGAYAYTAQGENFYGPRIWDPFVAERFLLWAEKCAEYVADNPEFSLLGTEEYTMSGAWTQPGYTAQAFIDLWQSFAQRVTAKAGACLVHINTGWSVYYPNNYSLDKPITDALLTHAVLLGPTDLRKDGNSGSATLSTSFGSYMFNSPTHPTQPGYQGIAGFAISYEWPDYSSVESPAEHLRWAVDDLGLHFIAWDPDKTTGTGTSGSWTWAQALAAVNEASGRINTTVPSSIASFAAYPTQSDTRRFAWVDPAIAWANTLTLQGVGAATYPYMQVNSVWTNPRPITEFPEPGVLAASRDPGDPAPAGEYTIARVTHPTNAARQAILHRIDPRYLAYSGSTQRSQFLTYAIRDDVTYWLAFSYRMGADASGASINCFDVHTSGDSIYGRQPIELFWTGSGFRLEHFGQYNSSLNTQNDRVREVSWTSATLPLETWQHIVMRFRVSRSWAGNPFIQAWHASGNGTLTQVVDRSDIMLGFWNQTAHQCYPKLGLYRWDLTVRATAHSTGLYVFRDESGTPTISAAAMHALLMDRQ